MIAKNYIVKKKKEMELNHSFSESQVQSLFSLPLLWESLEEQFIFAGESLDSGSQPF